MIGVQQRRHRHPNLGIFRKLEIRRHDADDGAGFVVDGDHASDKRGIAAVEALPGSVAEQNDPGRTGSIFIGAKETSELRPNAEQRKEVRRYQLAGEPYRFRAFGDGDASAAVGGDACERARLISPIEIVGKGDVGSVVVFRIVIPERDESIRVFEGKGAEYDRVEAREQRRVRGDAQRQTNDRDDRERWVLSQRPAGVTNVLQEGVHWGSGFAPWRRTRSGPGGIHSRASAGVRHPVVERLINNSSPHSVVRARGTSPVAASPTERANRASCAQVPYTFDGYVTPRFGDQ